MLATIATTSPPAPGIPGLWGVMPLVPSVSMPARAGYPPVFAIAVWFGGSFKSMYSIFAAISETDVKNRVHASSSRFGAPSSSLGQLGTISRERATILPHPLWG